MGASGSPADASILAKVSWRAFRVPFRVPFANSRQTMSSREGLAVVVEADSGEVGVGEASPLPEPSVDVVGETAVALEALAEASTGRPAAEAWTRDVPLPGGPPPALAAARCGLETAVADLLARREEVPLYRWLATQARFPCPDAPPRLPVNAVVDADSASDVSRAVAQSVARGFRAVKLKVGREVEHDLERVAAARAAAGPGIELRVDANGGWSMADALAFLERAAAYRLALCEEPVIGSSPDHHLGSLARLRRQVSTPIAVDESCSSIADLERVLAAGAADVAILKPMATGLRESVAMLALARARGLPAIVTTTFDAGVGTAMAAQLAALLPPPRPACGLATLDHLEHSLACGTPGVERGAMVLPAGPGLGTSWDDEALACYATGLRGEVRS